MRVLLAATCMAALLAAANGRLAGGKREVGRFQATAKAVLASVKMADAAKAAGSDTDPDADGPAEGARDTSDVLDEKKASAERPKLPPLNKVFVVASIQSRGHSVEEVVASRRAYKAALASVLPESTGVTGNDVAIELIKLVPDVAGTTGTTAELPVVEKIEEEEDAGAEETQKEKAAREREEEKKAASTSLLEVGTDPLPPNVQIRFRIVASDRVAAQVLSSVAAAGAGSDNDLEAALLAEGVTATARIVAAPRLITELDGREEESSAAPAPSSADALAQSSRLLPSFGLLLSLVAGLFVL